ncbi:MAG: molybdate ABC transporter substrate-binding protein [Nitrosomonadales bacterium]|nr:molybdate ABC transporter substrate-binding protein [Nitrosomonadales bacterium]
MLGMAALLLWQGMLAQAEPLTVAVAENVQFAFDDIAAEFKTEYGMEVKGVFGSSSKLATQVKNGAPFDVFISADTDFPEELYKKGLAASHPRVYAHGVLVLWTAKELDLSRGVKLLGDEQIKTVAICNPKISPYGRAALKAIEKARLGKTVEPKLVFGETVTQTAEFVDSGAADIGFIAKSVVIAPDMAGKGKWVEIPKANYDTIAQSAVILKHGEETQADSVYKFYAFLFSPKARAILKKYGYVLP